MGYPITPSPRNASFAMSRRPRRWCRNSAVRRRLQVPVAPHAQVGLRLVAGETLDRAQARAVLADRSGGLGLDLLVGAGLEKLAHPQAAGVARRLARG